MLVGCGLNDNHNGNGQLKYRTRQRFQQFFFIVKSIISIYSLLNKNWKLSDQNFILHGLVLNIWTNYKAGSHIKA